MTVKSEKMVPDEINNALANAEIPKFYSNSFSCAIGQGDTVLLLKNAQNPVCVVNLSYTTAKTLAIKLQGIINHLETVTGNKIMTTDDVDMFFRKDMEKLKK